MCRLFGFRSVIESQVHHSLVRAENALILQSEKHPDGWGVAYYVAGSPHVIKSASTAIQDSLFRHVSGVVSSETVIAHIRKATHGEMSILNTHPFQYGAWVFAHNGNLAGFEGKKADLRALIAPRLQRFLLGQTDSEVLFYLILTHLSKRVELHRPGCSVEIVAAAVQDALRDVIRIIGPYSTTAQGDPYDTYLTFLLTNGSTLLGHHGGKELFYSTYKRQCSQRHLCSSFGPSCEAPSPTGFINHLLLSSEPLQGENVWYCLEPGQMVGVDWRMQIHLFDRSFCEPSSLPQSPRSQPSSGRSSP